MSALKSTACRISSGQPFDITIAHVPLLSPVFGAAYASPPLPYQSLLLETSRPPVLAGLETFPSDRGSGDRRTLASRRLPHVLEPHLQGEETIWQKKDLETSSRADLWHGRENPTWGAPHVHGELLKLGFHLSERTVSRWMKRAPRNPDPARRWLAFLRNHREAIAPKTSVGLDARFHATLIRSRSPIQSLVRTRA
jgi:hypothetical protein